MQQRRDDIAGRLVGHERSTEIILYAVLQVSAPTFLLALLGACVVCTSRTHGKSDKASLNYVTATASFCMLFFTSFCVVLFWVRLSELKETLNLNQLRTNVSVLMYTGTSLVAGTTVEN